MHKVYMRQNCNKSLLYTIRFVADLAGAKARGRPPIMKEYESVAKAMPHPCRHWADGVSRSFEKDVAEQLLLQLENAPSQLGSPCHTTTNLVVA